MGLLCIRDATVVPGTPPGAVLERASILIDGARIAAVGPQVVPPPGAEILEGRDLIAIPGLVNAHTHSIRTVQRGICENLPLDLWLAWINAHALTFPREAIYLSALAGATELLRGGTTALLDHYKEFPGLSVEGMDAVMQAYEQAGIRAALAPELRDRPGTEALPTHLLPPPPELRPRLDGRPADVEADLAAVETICQRWHGRHGRLQVMFGPSAPERCTDAFWRRLAERSRALGIGMHTHLLETKLQTFSAQRLYGVPTLRHLDALGLLDAQVAFAHSIWLTDEEIALLGQRRGRIVHNPVANLRVGDGIAAVVALHEQGVSIGLGTDGAASNDRLNMFEVLKQAGLLHRATTWDYHRWLGAATILHWGTMGGARAPGKAADIVLLRRRSRAFEPLNDLLVQLVYCEDGSSVEAVLVAGRVVVRGGRLLTVDEEALYRELEAFREKIPADWARPFHEVRDYLDRLYQQAMAEPTPIRALLT
ncbi:MAG: amidohydrolase [Deltaproteobacteria bacterium]|nr:amidohydrolase [Deltaproteobacteria bacterium]